MTKTLSPKREQVKFILSLLETDVKVMKDTLAHPEDENRPSIGALSPQNFVSNGATLVKLLAQIDMEEGGLK